MSSEGGSKLITAAALSTHDQKLDYQTWMQSNQKQDFLVLVYDFVKSVWFSATSELKCPGTGNEIALMYKTLFFSGGLRNSIDEHVQGLRRTLMLINLAS